VARFVLSREFAARLPLADLYAMRVFAARLMFTRRRFSRAALPLSGAPPFSDVATTIRARYRAAATGFTMLTPLPPAARRIDASLLFHATVSAQPLQTLPLNISAVLIFWPLVDARNELHSRRRACRSISAAA